MAHHHNAKRNTLISPQGERITFTGIYAFAEANGLTGTGLSNLINKKIEHFRGWRLPEEGSENKTAPAKVKAPVKAKETARKNKENDYFKMVMSA